jgi:FMN phosphatase YigB (HAD superfamily)
LIFDLDDTLLDTYGQLVPQASKEACTVMIEQGLGTDLASCLKAREEIAQSSARTDLFPNLVARFGVSNGAETKAVADAGFKAFYDRKVESSIALFPGLRDMLHDLKDKYGLHLVTAGHPETQEEKLRLLDLRALFDSTTIVNTFIHETKGQAFRAIAKRTGSSASNHLSIGNRLDTDIAPAKILHWATCWVQYGEYARSVPQNDFEKPDFTIKSIRELISTCRL